MNKSRLLLNTKKPEQPKPDNDNENVPKTRASRFAKTSKFLNKTAIDYFEIRKPLNIYMIDELNELGRKTYFQRVFIMALNIDEEKFIEYWRSSRSTLSDLRQPNFREYIQCLLDAIFETCEKKKSTADHLSGLLITMGNTHTYLMVEGAEDMIANFFEELDLVHDRIWVSSRVFLVEDKIGETYFNCFYSRRSPAINTNEKFSPSTSSDCNLMAVQHLKLKEKVKCLAATLAIQLEKDGTQNVIETSKDILIEPFYLPADPFNKLLPEIQRIDLVLNANKFYRTVKDFSQTYRVLQIHQDEDSFLWPIQDNYTPLQIFKRSEFDVNLTFGRGGKDERKEKEEEDASHDMEEVSQNT